MADMGKNGCSWVLTNKEWPQDSSQENGVSPHTAPNEPGWKVHDACYEEADIGCKQVEAQPQEVSAQGGEEEKDVCQGRISASRSLIQMDRPFLTFLPQDSLF